MFVNPFSNTNTKQMCNTRNTKCQTEHDHVIFCISYTGRLGAVSLHAPNQLLNVTVVCAKETINLLFFTSSVQQNSHPAISNKYINCNSCCKQFGLWLIDSIN